MSSEAPADPHVSGVVLVTLGGPDADLRALAQVEGYFSGARFWGLATFERFDRAGVLRVRLSQGEDPRLLLRRVGERLHRWLRVRLGQAPWIGMSRTATSRDALHRGIGECRVAVSLGQRFWGGPRVVLYEDVLPLAVVEAEPEMRASLARVVGPLVVYDRKGRTQLVRTLEAYLQGDLSTVGAARVLRVHRHTVEQRIKRIEQILGRSVADGHDRLLLELALVARRLAPGGPAEAGSRLRR